jgi:hypothetical protein
MKINGFDLRSVQKRFSGVLAKLGKALSRITLI